MNQILAGMVDDKILGPEAGLCVKLNKDENGNIASMDFSMNSTAFNLGSADITDEATKNRIKTIKNYVLGYTSIKNPNVKIDDIDVQIKSYADGVGGPVTYDSEISQLENWGDLIHYIGKDQASIKYLNTIIPQSKNNFNAPVNFGQLDNRAQSIIRNIVLGKKRSEAICKELGINNCSSKPNYGFASPDLEKNKKDCPERRISLIKINLNKNSQVVINNEAEFHPDFRIPESDEEKSDMQLAASFDLFKRHNENAIRYSEESVRKNHVEELLNQSTLKYKDDLKAKLIEASNSFSKNKFTLLDFPNEIVNSYDYPVYREFLYTLNEKHEVLRKDLEKYPQVRDLMEAGSFIEFKKTINRLDDKSKKEIESALTKFQSYKNDNDPTTDYFNYFSAGQAIQYNLINHSDSPYLHGAAEFMKSSNESLKIKLDTKDTLGLGHEHDPKRSSWQCYGGCESGIVEGDDGKEFKTVFRSYGFKDKTATQMQNEFKEPTSFGAMKTLNVYTIKKCANCDCLKNPNVTMDSILNDSNRTIKTAITKFTKRSDGSRGFEQDIGAIEDPNATCIYTPPVAHTCQVMPKGKNNGPQHGKNAMNYACPYYDTKDQQHGLKWTTNFIKDGLNLATNADKVLCNQQMVPLEEKASQAICNKTSEPVAIPDSCK